MEGPQEFPPSTDKKWAFTDVTSGCQGTFQVVDLATTDDERLQKVHAFTEAENPDAEYSVMRFELDWTSVEPGPDTRDQWCGPFGLQLWAEDWTEIEPGSVEDLIPDDYSGDADPAEIVNMFIGVDDLGARAGKTGVDYAFFTEDGLEPFIAVSLSTVDEFGERIWAQQV